MTAAPLIGIGMPVFNAERWLPRSIDSILSQTFSDFALVISDNASTDGTEEICRDYASRDSRVVYHRNDRNIGLNSNYTLAFRRTDSEFFKWASSNDICSPKLLERCVEVLQDRPDAVLCYSKTLLITGDGTAESYSDDFVCEQSDPCARVAHLLDAIRLNNAMNGLIRSDVLARTALIEDYFSSDIVLLMELACHGPLLQVPEALFQRRMSPDASTRLRSQEECSEYFSPQNPRGMLFPHWKLQAGCARAALRAPLSLSQKCCLAQMLLKRLYWSRGDLLGDLWQAMHSGAGTASECRLSQPSPATNEATSDHTMPLSSWNPLAPRLPDANDSDAPTVLSIHTSSRSLAKPRRSSEVRW
jgi:hypothetical protein